MTSNLLFNQESHYMHPLWPLNWFYDCLLGENHAKCISYDFGDNSDFGDNIVLRKISIPNFGKKKFNQKVNCYFVDVSSVEPSNNIQKFI